MLEKCPGLFKVSLMATKRELQQELQQLKERLHRNEHLMRRAAAKAEEMMALRDECDALQEEVRRLKSGPPKM